MTGNAVRKLGHAPHPFFRIEGPELTVGGIAVSRLAERVGQTPFYAYDRHAIDRRIADLRQHLPREISLHYAVKANPMPAVVAHIAPLVDGLDLASAGELAVALDIGANPQHISFAGPGKTEAELQRAAAAGICVNVESERELRILVQYARSHSVRPRVAIRVNPDFELKTSGMKMGGGPKQFGIDAERVPQVLRDLRGMPLEFVGFHIYGGSQNLRADAIAEAEHKALELAIALAADAPGPVTSLNLGGGFGIPYFPGEQPLDLATVGGSMQPLVERAKQALPQAEVVIELGRYVVGECGVYVCRVLDRKLSRGHVFLVTDGGLHHHLAASGNFGQVVRKNYPVLLASQVDRSILEQASVVGPLCTPLDLLGDRLELPRAAEGDLIAVLQSGAYGLTASPQSFLSHPVAREILV
ncbi:MAG TPA: pyridoxal-dependent decarboxylase, exosortase A system-associated [Steroidobacteraceae bacterium]|nr:pyridoxal-dependent decarboxylase, exosortase A system-associated [Steroidobacteraceae bacterium]HRX90539.1 pyridoxal-dependent decarboxylase, exosortase A system-associated [Steroidobacteraceae bacterium]